MAGFHRPQAPARMTWFPRSSILTPMDLLADLNAGQLQAVTHGDGPLLIIAGVGTGKTTAITRRIAWLISEKKALPAEILALTFTEKAAAEMEERVDLLVPYGYVEAQIGTFHAFCDRLLRENAILLGLTPDYQILTQAEQAIFLKEHLFDLPLHRFRPLGNPMKHMRAILTLFSRAKDEDVSPEEYADFAQRNWAEVAADSDEIGDAESLASIEEAANQKELSEVYEAYQRLLLEHGRVDFGDMITLALRLLREHPEVLARTQERFRYLLVDEFQDTNYAQFELLKLLAGHRNLTVCGDDDQSIYKFRGAAISNILGFQAEYPDAKTVVLTENYRSTQAILDSAYRLIQHNNPDRLEIQSEIDKRLHSNTERGRAPHQFHFEMADEECDFAAETIAQRVRDEGRTYKDFAILVRTNARASGFLRSLNLLNIPWHFSGSRGLYDQEEVRTAIAFLRVLADPRDDPSLHYLASSFLYDVAPETLASAASLARRRNRPLLDVLRSVRQNPAAFDASAESVERLARLGDDLAEMLSLSTREKTGEILYQYLSTQTGTIERLSNSEDARDAQRIQNLAKLFSIIERYSQVTRYDRVAWFIDYLDDLIEAGDNPPVGDASWDTDAVSVLTIHQAKGLEYPVVFLVGLIAGSFPSANRRDPIPLPEALIKESVGGADFHRQEERRLFYVGMTRAKDDLYLTSAQDHGGKRPRKPSLFVSEALDLDAGQLTPQARSPLAAILRHGKGADSAAGASDAKKPDDLMLFPTGDKILSLSHQQVDDYLTCPLKYRYRNVLRVPARIHHTVVYGNAIHQAIRLFNLNRHAGRTTPVAELHQIFRKQWNAEGFLTRQHEELRLQQGLEALTNFHAFESADPSVPTHVERRFSITDQGIRLVGIFDRIDLDEDEGKIIDYKTSQVQSREQAEKRAKDSRQLAIYSLAYEHLFGSMPTALELRFLTPEVWVGSTRPTRKMIDKARADIDRAADGIRAERFPGEPAYQACRYCSYAGICPDKRSD